MSDVEYESSDLDELLGKLGNLGGVKHPDSEDDSEASAEYEREMEERREAPRRTQMRRLEGLEEQYLGTLEEFNRARKRKGELEGKLQSLLLDILEEATEIRKMQGREGFVPIFYGDTMSPFSFIDLETDKVYSLNKDRITPLVQSPPPRTQGGVARPRRFMKRR